MDPIGANGATDSPNKTRSSSLEALDSQYQIFLVILYSMTALLAFVFNLFGVIVLIRSNRFSPELKKYLINLACSDMILALFSIPFTYTDFMYGQWIFALELCPVSQFIQILSACVSIYTLIAIGLERFFAVIYPFNFLLVFERYTLTVIIIIWIIGFTIAFPELIESRAVEFVFNGETLYDCRELWETTFAGKLYTYVILFSTFIIPFTVLAFMYTTIGIKTFKNIIPGNADNMRDQAQHKAKQKLIKVLVILVISFAISWTPIQIFNFLFWIFDDLRFLKTKTAYHIYVCVYFACHWLAMSHSVINPFIYCFLTNSFELNDIRRLFNCRERIKSNQQSQSTSQT